MQFALMRNLGQVTIVKTVLLFISSLVSRKASIQSLFEIYGQKSIYNMSLTIPNLVPQRPFCCLNFNSVAKPQKFGSERYDAHVLASSKTYRKQNKPKK